MVAALERLRQKSLQLSQEKSEEWSSDRSNWPEVRFGLKTLLDFRSFDALNLWSSPALKKKIGQSLGALGLQGPKAIRTSGGATRELGLAEQAFANFFRTEDALLFSSKSQAVFSVLSALISEGDRVLGHEFCLAPLEDICFLTGANYEQRVQEKADGDTKSRIASSDLLVPVSLEFIESISINSGSNGISLNDLNAKKSFLVCDESAAFGVSGLRGAGRLEELLTGGIMPNNLCIISDLSHITDSPATVIAGPSALCEFIRGASTSLKIESALSVGHCLTLLETLDFLSLMNFERELLKIRAGELRLEIQALPKLPLMDGDSHIFSFLFKKIDSARTFQSALLEQGVLADLISAASLRKEAFLVRLILGVGHSQQHCAKLLEALGQIAKRVNV